jgi:hypothetical protein
MLEFGTIFRHKEEYYVYLVQVEELIFVAKIHDIETTKRLVRSRENKSKNPHNHTDEQPLYCFIILTTNSFENHCAHYGRPNLPNDTQPEIISKLNEGDLENLKNEIKKDGAASPLLRETISKLFP